MSKIYGIPVATPINPGKIDGSGANGKSAYELAVENGFEGTLEDWLNSLVGPPCPVDSTLSVEGQAADAKATGEAILNHVFSTSNPHGVTPAQIGAAPAGYGFGETLLVGGRTIFAFEGESIEAYCAKIDSELAGMTDYTGKLVLARCVNSLGNFYGFSGNCQAVLYRGAGEGNASLVTIGAPYDWEIRKIDGVWQQPEWVNPPMFSGNEYRTRERYNGNPVYVMIANLGNLPAGGMSEIHLEDNCRIISFDATYGENQGTLDGMGYKCYSANHFMIRILNEGGTDWSGFTAKALVKYWKTTD